MGFSSTKYIEFMQQFWRHLAQYKVLWIFLFLDTIANYVQACLTPITPNEAFYLEMAQEPFEWGYIAQAPMVIWWVKLGTSWLGNSTIGIRLLSIVSGLIGKILLWNFIDQNNKQRKQLVFATILLSLLSLQFFCFLAMMDAAFFLFFSYFLWTMQRYVRSNSIAHALLLGFSISLLLYAKYESFIPVLVALVVFWQLFTRRSFILVLISLGITLFPHILYNIEHDFGPYQKLLHTYFLSPQTEHMQVRHMLGNLFTYSGFLLLPYSLYIVIVRGGASRFTLLISLLLILHLVLYNILAFYTNMQFWRGGVAISVCIVYLVYTYYLNNPGWQSVMLLNFMVAFALIVSYRVALSREMYNPFTNTQKYRQQLAFLTSMAEGKPIALVDMPQTLALAHCYFPKYSFLACSSSPATLSALDQHKYYQAFNGQRVLLVSKYHFVQADTFKFLENAFYCKDIPHFFDKGVARLKPYNGNKYIFNKVNKNWVLLAELNLPYDSEQLVNYDSSIVLTFRNNVSFHTLHTNYHIENKCYQNGNVLFKISIQIPQSVQAGASLCLNLTQAGLEIRRNPYYALQYPKNNK